MLATMDLPIAVDITVTSKGRRCRAARRGQAHGSGPAGAGGGGKVQGAAPAWPRPARVAGSWSGEVLAPAAGEGQPGNGGAPSGPAAALGCSSVNSTRGGPVASI